MKIAEKLVKIMTDEEQKVVPMGRDVTRVELAQAIEKYILECRPEESKLCMLMKYGFPRAVGHTWTELN